jgi:hypothetical protein
MRNDARVKISELIYGAKILLSDIKSSEVSKFC